MVRSASNTQKERLAEARRTVEAFPAHVWDEPEINVMNVPCRSGGTYCWRLPMIINLPFGLGSKIVPSLDDHKSAIEFAAREMRRRGYDEYTADAGAWAAYSAAQRKAAERILAAKKSTLALTSSPA